MVRMMRRAGFLAACCLETPMRLDDCADALPRSAFKELISPAWKQATECAPMRTLQLRRPDRVGGTVGYVVGDSFGVHHMNLIHVNWGLRSALAERRIPCNDRRRRCVGPRVQSPVAAATRAMA